MLDAEKSERLIRFFEDLLVFYQEFLDLERKKYNVVLSEKLGSLDEGMNQEQAFSLKARGLESSRQGLLKEMGIQQCTFRELIPQVDLSKQEQMRSLYQELSSTVSSIQSVNSKCTNMIRFKRERVSHILAHAENHPELKQIYGSKLQGAAEHPVSFSKKI
jgi:hypothetical protein